MNKYTKDYTKEEANNMTLSERQYYKVLKYKPVEIKLVHQDMKNLKYIICSKIYEVFVDDVDEWKKQYTIDYKNKNYQPYYNKKTFELLNRFPFEYQNIRSSRIAKEQVIMSDHDKVPGDVTYQIEDERIDEINKDTDIREEAAKYKKLLQQSFRQKVDSLNIPENKEFCRCGCVITSRGLKNHQKAEKCIEGRRKYSESVKNCEVPVILTIVNEVETKQNKKVKKTKPVEPIKYVQITEEQYVEYMALKQKFN